MEKVTILGVLLANRTVTSPCFQEIISKHGCNIKTRIGLHTVSDGKCSTDGVILLETIGTDEEIESLAKDIEAIPDAQVQRMSFNIR
ncbi:MAG: hypothetical protein A2287_05245 [Candidatus Melainabacteria bacterium RIFOXYA12_FULL_32_12]|nr:MAG: hypothetical protein A2255_02955 [Candidatus Melainabacteria bacterium RIFOXYA2_FULL_32_9]OGI31678.1 MAG: hypothetical protein A2287_05245 [Candidatus Melainabacteria bacterium RIFOXYA12_FULL_32_12]